MDATSGWVRYVYSWATCDTAFTIPELLEMKEAKASKKLCDEFEMFAS